MQNSSCNARPRLRTIVSSLCCHAQDEVSYQVPGTSTGAYVLLRIPGDGTTDSRLQYKYAFQYALCTIHSHPLVRSPPREPWKLAETVHIPTFYLCLSAYQHLEDLILRDFVIGHRPVISPSET